MPIFLCTYLLKKKKARIFIHGSGHITPKIQARQKYLDKYYLIMYRGE